MKKVKLKTFEELKQMVKDKKIDLIHVSDDGEMYHFGTKGNPSHVLSVWASNFGEEYLIVDHDNPISSSVYEHRKIFFYE